ncbi:MAG: imidazoleglycerol-phosphate dehydratase HisB [Acetobacteraceae bacterium]|nr:imidazoleglycerol-phosphate dehydratase HisB [Acetobacteraceae bacterium]
MTTPRRAEISRETAETRIACRLCLDGTGQAKIATGVGFLDHMLHALARHSLLDLELTAEGDLHIDAHHTVEDCGIVLGQALKAALGDKRGITRYGFSLLPMDEALAECALDVSGRPFLAWSVPFARDKVGDLDTELFEEFFRALAFNAGITLHVTLKAGTNQHHIAEACFKALARSLRMAVEPDPRQPGLIPSTKGVLEA